MQSIFIRIDDRLIHGQVIISWVNHLHTKNIILCDDSIAGSEWESELYLSIVPEELTAKVFSVDDTAKYIISNAEEMQNTIILISSPTVLEKLVDNNIKIDKVNVGGIHYKDEKEKYLTYLYLDNEDKASFRRCFNKGINFECLDVPDGKKIALENIISLQNPN